MVEDEIRQFLVKLSAFDLVIKADYRVMFS